MVLSFLGSNKPIELLYGGFMFRKVFVLATYLLFLSYIVTIAALDLPCTVRDAQGVEVAIQNNGHGQIDKAKVKTDAKSGTDVTIRTVNGRAAIFGTFFDHGSDILIVMGPGFGKPRGTLQYYAQIFQNYDVLIFDYCWRTNIKNFMGSFKSLRAPIAALFDGPWQDVISVVQYGTSHKKYKKVVGLGICYSAYQFLAAEAECQKNQVHLFDALIIDSCPLSTVDVQKQVFRNISLLYNPLQSTEPGWLQYIWGLTRVPGMLAWLSSKFSNYSVLPLCAQIGQIPVLCIHGRADRLVPLESFERMWAAIQSHNKMALITPSSHVLNIRNQAVYKVVCDQFIAGVV
jgi:pimeloyl-ACP methyl ester carboxylesterase